MQQRCTDYSSYHRYNQSTVSAKSVLQQHKKKAQVFEEDKKTWL
jgi:hypothetical protein